MKIERTVNIVNRRARFEYEILEEYEAGIVLYGTEIKSLRSSKASIAESFCQMKDGELWVVNMMIDEYKMGSFYNHKAKRDGSCYYIKENSVWRKSKRCRVYNNTFKIIYK
jgi:SsrA-binding protein